MTPEQALRMIVSAESAAPTMEPGEFENFWTTLAGIVGVSYQKVKEIGVLDNARRLGVQDPNAVTLLVHYPGRVFVQCDQSFETIVAELGHPMRYGQTVRQIYDS